MKISNNHRSALGEFMAESDTAVYFYNWFKEGISELSINLRLDDIYDGKYYTEIKIENTAHLEMLKQNLYEFTQAFKIEEEARRCRPDLDDYEKSES